MPGGADVPVNADPASLRDQNSAGLEGVMSSSPTLSVVMCNYNHARFLPEAFGSIAAQSYAPSEIIVIDDASTDNSVEIIEAFAHQEIRVRLIRNERNMGVIRNLNRLIHLASGDYIYGLAADDRALPGLFEKSMSLLARYPKAGMCSSLSRVIDEGGKDKGTLKTRVISSYPTYITPAQALKLFQASDTWIVGNTTFYRRQALLDEGGFNANLHSFCDGFVQQVIAARYGACFIPEPLGCWRVMDSGFFNTTAMNIDLYFEIGAHAATLMRSRYAHLFPEEYVRNWEKQWHYSAMLSAWGILSKRQDKLLSDSLKRWSTQTSWLDRILIMFVKFPRKIESAAVRLYVLIKFGNTRKWLRNKFNSIFDRNR